jgi:RNA polymerase sigma factor (sigma-70 family)
MVVASGDVRLPRLLRREAGAEVDRLYRRHSGEVLRYAMLVLRSRTDAEDVTQSVFLRALRAIERGEKVRTPRNWLIKIAHNECRRLVASRKLHLELPDEIAVEPVEPGRAEELRAAMDALPATQRHALVLRELEGRTYAEIAQSLDVSESAVETLIFRARRAVREQLEHAMSCEEFGALLDDPAARARVRAHARVCAPCATLDHQSRGRKGALKRIASALGLPWWGAKLAGVALTTATVAAVAVSAPHDGSHPAVPSVQPAAHRAHPLNLIPLTAHRNLGVPERGTRAKPLNLVPPGSHSKLTAAHGGGTRFKSAAAKPPAVLPGPEEPAPTTPDPAKPDPAPVPPPTKIVPLADPLPVATDPAPVLSDAQSVLPPVPEVPAVPEPTVSVPIPAPALPTVTLPVEPPNVSLP